MRRLIDILFPSVRWKQQFREEQRRRQQSELATLRIAARESAWLDVIEDAGLEAEAGEALSDALDALTIDEHEMRLIHQRERDRS